MMSLLSIFRPNVFQEWACVGMGVIIVLTIDHSLMSQRVDLDYLTAK